MSEGLPWRATWEIGDERGDAAGEVFQRVRRPVIEALDRAAMGLPEERRDEAVEGLHGALYGPAMGRAADDHVWVYADDWARVKIEFDPSA